MNIQVTINMGQGDNISSLPGTSIEIAEKIIEAAGGDITKDTCSVLIQDSGMAGGAIPTEPPIEPPVEPPIEPPVEPVHVNVNSTFATNNSSPPGDKQTRTNASMAADTTAIFVDKQSTEGDDISAKLLALLLGDVFELRGVNDATRYSVFTLNAAPIDQTDFVELPVSMVEAGNPLTNSACTLTFPDREV